MWIVDLTAAPPCHRSMDPLTGTVATTVLVEGTKFLYQQASEVLKAWRSRRLGKDSGWVRVPVPEAVTMGNLSPLAEPRDRRMEDTLAELRDRAEDVTTGVVDPSSGQAGAVVAELRGYLENVLRTSITFAGEKPRTFEAGNVSVVTGLVEGEVAGVRTSAGATKVGDISVRTQAIGKNARIIGADVG